MYICVVYNLVTLTTSDPDVSELSSPVFTDPLVLSGPEISSDSEGGQHVSSGQATSFISADAVVSPVAVADDPASWIRIGLSNENIDSMPNNITDFVIENLLSLQDINIDFSSFERHYGEGDGVKRRLTKSMFYSELPNGQEIRRTWLMYSLTSKKVYCFPCTLFCKRATRSSFSYHGFDDWSHASTMLKSHEKSQDHRLNTAILIERQRGRGLDHKIKEQYEKEKQYWRAVLKRLIPVIQFLSRRGLAFRGANEIIGSSQNGNYLGILELLSLFDDFLAAHIVKYANRGKGSTSYLSSTVCNELITILGTDVRNHIIKEIVDAKYFSLILDSTPDVSHTDQFTIIFRFVDKEGQPVERFLQFTPISSHKAADLEETVVNILEKMHINLNKCRGQCYDNASEMSGAYSGLQTRIRNRNKYAIYVPCGGHSLNLVGNSAAESCLLATKYFMLLQRLYTFLSASTRRWKIVTDIFRKCGNYRYEQNIDENVEELGRLLDEDDPNVNLPPENPIVSASTSSANAKFKTNRRLSLPKGVSFTRWSAKHIASKALTTSYDCFIKVFDEISKDEDQNGKIRAEASSFLKKLSNFDMVFMALVWDAILERMDAVNKSIQGKNTNLGSLVGLYGSLEEYFNEMRDKRFEEFYEKVAKLHNAENENKNRIKRRKFQFGENQDETVFDFKQKLQYDCYNVILDKLITEMKNRKNAYNEVYNLFSFLINFKNTNLEKLREGAAKLVEFYDEDLDSGLIEESVHFKQYLSSLADESQSLLSDPALMLKHIIISDLICTFPNMYIALQIYLTIPVTNASGERSFSVLKRIKNYLRSVLGQEKLSSLAILAIESEITNKIDIDSIIDKFAQAKIRRKVF